MQVAIVGAGAVGLNLAARLRLAGTSVRLIARRDDAARAIAREGIRLEDPATGRAHLAQVDVACGIAALRNLVHTPVLVCVRSGQTADLAAELSRVVPRAVVASAQNDVDNEALLARHFAEVIGIVVRQTCTRRDDRSVLATGAGRLVVGSHPTGMTRTAHALADCFEAAGFDVARSDAIGADKWLKLCVNFLSSVNALVVRSEHSHEAFVQLKQRLLEEARATFAAAGIRPRSCDGADRGIDAEIESLRAAWEAGTTARALPLYNACWAALSDPNRPLESDLHHRRLLELAARSGTPAPTHAVMLEAVLDAYQNRRGPECCSAGELLARAREAERA